LLIYCTSLVKNRFNSLFFQFNAWKSVLYLPCICYFLVCASWGFSGVYFYEGELEGTKNAN
jgi:hypothetical protein